MMRLSKSVLGPAERDAVDRILRAEFLGTGPETQQFEQELATYLGGGVTVVCVNTGTAALQLACQACGLAPGDEVLVPSLTYVASFQAITAAGATPVACEVHPATALLDLEDAARRLSPRTRAIMPVHYASSVGDLPALYGFARKHGLRVVEDAAHAFGCTHQGAKVGAQGDVVCFSFDGIKNITSGEGGAVVTRDPGVAERVRDARLLGVMRDSENRYQRKRSWDFDVSHAGWRYHMSDIMAAIGRVQLRRFEADFRPRGVALAQRYRERLRGMPGVALLTSDLGPVVPHILPIRVLAGRRDAVRQQLEAAGIGTGIHYKPNHLLTRFRSPHPLPRTEALYEELLSLPLHPDLGETDVDRVTDALEQALALPAVLAK